MTNDTIALPKPWILKTSEYINWVVDSVKIYFNEVAHKKKEQTISNAITEKEEIINDPTEIIESFNSGIKDFLFIYLSNPKKIKKFNNFSEFLYATKKITPEDLHKLCFNTNKINVPDLKLDTIVNEEPINEYGLSILMKIGARLNKLTQYLNEKQSNLFQFYRDTEKIPLKELSSVFYVNMWDLEPSTN